MKFNSNKERRAYWEILKSTCSTEELEKALNMLKPDTRKVLCLHYQHHRSLQEITVLISRSITVVRNHHNRGIYKLYRYFNPRVPLSK